MKNKVYEILIIKAERKTENVRWCSRISICGNEIRVTLYKYDRQDCDILPWSWCQYGFEFHSIYRLVEELGELLKHYLITDISLLTESGEERNFKAGDGEFEIEYYIRQLGSCLKIDSDAIYGYGV